MNEVIFSPGPTPITVRAADGKVLTAPDGWILFPPGDAALTRRVKAAGDHWVVQEKKGRKIFSRGVWAPAGIIDRIRAELVAERSTESFAKRKEADAKRRDKAQAVYAEDFSGAVVTFLAFHPAHADLAQRLARVVADHATPVGSGTVARTKRIPLEQRAEAAVIAWMSIKRLPTIQCRFHELKTSGEKCDGCWPSDQKNYWPGTDGEKRERESVRS